MFIVLTLAFSIRGVAGGYIGLQKAHVVGGLGVGLGWRRHNVEKVPFLFLPPRDPLLGHRHHHFFISLGTLAEGCEKRFHEA